MSKHSLEDFIDIGHTIKLLRKRKKLSQRRLAQKIGVVHQAISLIETNRNIPTIETFFKIINVCGYTLEFKEDIYKTPKKLTLPSSSRSKTPLTLPTS